METTPITPKIDAVNTLRRIARIDIPEVAARYVGAGLESSADHLKEVAKVIEKAADWIEGGDH